MLEFINNNEVLFSGLFGLLCALIAAAVTVIANFQKSKRESLKSLRAELATAKKEISELQEKLHQYQNIETLEEKIDKTDGEIYKEYLSNGDTREICACCWESKHIRVPLLPKEVEEEDTHERYRRAWCQVCGACCRSLSVFPEPSDYEIDTML